MYRNKYLTDPEEVINIDQDTPGSEEYSVQGTAGIQYNSNLIDLIHM